MSLKVLKKQININGQHQEDKSINYIKMSNIGSISNSGNKFNVVASTLSTEQLESFGKSGNLMPNAIIVSTSYINSYDNSLDLVISD